MPLDPQARDYLDKMASLRVPGFHTMAPPKARTLFRAMRAVGGPPDPVAEVEDRVISPSIPIRIYRPIDGEPAPSPALIFFHGGGWVLGDIETVDNLCRRLANASGAVVISVDYRLSPEAKFPEPLDDCFRVVSAVAKEASRFGIDPAWIAVGGDSAGGNLAAAVALKARDRGDLPLAFQLLIYPITDHSLETSSYSENAEGFGLTREMMGWYWGQYLATPEDGRSQLASPLKAADLAGLPPALILTAEYDVLRDEGEAYAGRLREAGVPVQLRRFDGMIHGFLQMADSFDQGRVAIREAGLALREALRSCKSG
ncbi:alpha/beta hydrolase [Tundrisphaera lichenicola]|uniref:alpha/beta hydrolase n=1 Tax=Tundrisphaera lichenicola TaxID=2029860 RepID=UPI003EB7697D